MATDATGPVTSQGIPTFQTNVDAPSGKGFNASMAIIDTLLTSAMKTAFKKAGALIGTRRGPNFTDSTDVSFALTDDAAGDKVDISASLTTAQKLPTTAGDFEVPVWDAGTTAWVKSSTKKVPYGQLNLANGIVNADIAAGAAVALSKLAGYPSDATKFARGDGTWAAPSGGYVSPELAYADITSSVSIPSNSPTAPTAIVAAPQITLDGSTAIYIEFSAPGVVPPNTVGQSMLLQLWDSFNGGTVAVVSAIASIATGGNSPSEAILARTRKFTPAAGTHTFSIKGYCSSGTGSVTGQDPAAVAGNFERPAIRVIKA